MHPQRVQKVYRSKGVTINDKDVRIIVRWTLGKVRIEEARDTQFLLMELFDRFGFEDIGVRRSGSGDAPSRGHERRPLSFLTTIAP